MDIKNSAILRWVTLLAVVLNIAFNYFYVRITGHDTMGIVSARYPGLFTPAGYAFSIWGLIYTSFVIYCLVQLKPSSQEKKVYNQLSLSLLLANILTSVWIWVFTGERLLLSVILLAALLILSIEMFTTSARAAKQPKHSWWIQFPFSLFFGWLSVAFMANLSVWIAANQGTENQPLTFVLIGVAGIAGIFVSVRFRNPVYPAVVAWALTGIWVARKADHPYIANTALAVAGISVLLVIAISLKLLNTRRIRD